MQSPALVPNPAVIGRRHDAPATFATPERLAAYAAAIGDDNPRYQVGDGQVAPPLQAVVPLFAIVDRMLDDPEAGIDRTRLVHGEQDMIFHRLIRPWDIVTPRGRIVGIEEKRSGTLVRAAQTLWVDGEAAVEVTASYFIRSLTPPEATSRPDSPRAATPEWPAPLVRETRRIDDGMPARYAAASDDHNPLHLDDAAARAAGLPGRILHGLATMALAQSVIADRCCAGDPARLRRLSARFVKPVFPGDTLTFLVWDEGATLALAVQDGKGATVLSGSAMVADAAR